MEERLRHKDDDIACFSWQPLFNLPPYLDYQDIARENLQWSAALELPVASTFDGSDMRTCSDVTRELIQLITVKTVYWEKCTAENGVSCKAMPLVYC